MKEVITKDGTVTWYSEEFGEHYHSLSGANEEAILKHAKPAIDFLYKDNRSNSEINVLDFCFGLGYNGIRFLEEIRKIDKGVKVNIVGIDIDPEVVAKAKELFDKEIKELVDGKSATLRIIIGDCEAEVQKIDEKIDVCFFDPFSPKKCPKLWTADVFKRIYLMMKQRGILTTYSCARIARDNMKAAGFEVIDGPTVGRWAAATIAMKGK